MADRGSSGPRFGGEVGAGGAAARGGSRGRGGVGPAGGEGAPVRGVESAAPHGAAGADGRSRRRLHGPGQRRQPRLEGGACAARPADCPPQSSRSGGTPRSRRQDGERRPPRRHRSERPATRNSRSRLPRDPSRGPRRPAAHVESTLRIPPRSAVRACDSPGTVTAGPCRSWARSGRAARALLVRGRRVRVTTISSWYSSPTGITRRPPSLSCCLSGSGIARRRGRDHDRVEGRRLGPALVAVAGAHLHVAVAERAPGARGPRRPAAPRSRSSRRAPRCSASTAAW